MRPRRIRQVFLRKKLQNNRHLLRRILQHGIKPDLIYFKGSVVMPEAVVCQIFIKELLLSVKETIHQSFLKLVINRAEGGAVLCCSFSLGF